MKNKNVVVFVLAAVIIFGMVTTAFAQNKRVGTAAATELLIPVGGRDIALGGSAIASSKGVEAMYWNPAGLSRMTNSAQAMFSSMTYIADIGVNYFAAGGEFGDIGTFGLSIKTLDIGDILVTTNDDPDGLGGRIISPSLVTVGLTYARSITDAISAGATVKIISEQIDRVSASTVAFDFGVQYNNLAGMEGLGLGVALKHIGTQMKFDGSGLLRDAIATGGSRPVQKYKSEAASFELPSLFEIGLSYTRPVGENLNLDLNSSFTNNNLYRDEYKIGAELGYTIEGFKLFGRAGVTMVPKISDVEQDDIFGPTFGGGILTRTGGVDIIIDYAYRSVDFFDANQIFSVKFGF